MSLKMKVFIFIEMEKRDILYRNSRIKNLTMCELINTYNFVNPYKSYYFKE